MKKNHPKSNKRVTIMESANQTNAKGGVETQKPKRKNTSIPSVKKEAGNVTIKSGNSSILTTATTTVTKTATVTAAPALTQTPV
jgi:hypothetical protein